MVILGVLNMSVMKPCGHVSTHVQVALNKSLQVMLMFLPEVYLLSQPDTSQSLDCK